LKYRDFVPILTAHGFVLVREKATHKQYQGTVDGRIMLVTVDYSQPGEDISPRNLASMIRQSGLPKKLFR
jgi:predicted RNA binding protein YcfA (HicA-like mRNA interferase family)